MTQAAPAARPVPSEIADLRGISLQDVPALDALTLEKAAARVLPGPAADLVTLSAAFSSAI